jgi:tetratricopeptide (TPR) repeat protein
MTISKPLGAIAYVLLFSGCASIGISGNFQSGRQALLANRDEQALGYFQSVAEKDPNYTFIYDLFREGIWTYVGRVQYRVGRYEEARQSLERALSVDRNDNLARLYLGLTLARRSNYTQGLKDIQAGLRGLYDWLEYMQSSRPYTDFWDPLRQIRSEIKNDLDVISGKDIDWPKLIESAEWVGQQMEEEVGRVQRDEERRLRNREFPHAGGSIGIGIGF